MNTANSVYAAPKMSLYELTSNPQQQQNLIDIGSENLSLSIQKENGTLAMYHSSIKEHPTNNVILEIYQNESAYKLHTEANHFKKFVETAKTAVIERKSIPLDPQFLADKKLFITKAPKDNYIVNLAEITVKPEYNSSFKNIVIGEMYQSIQKEPNILVMYAATLTNNPNEWRFFEIYVNKEAYEQHQKSEHFQSYLSQTQKMIETKKIVELNGLNLVNKGGLRF